MELIVFLRQLLSNQTDFLQGKSVVYCVGTADRYPLLFLSSFRAALSTYMSKPIASLSYDNDQAAVSFYTSLETTFLGQQRWYWLLGVVGIDKKKKDSLQQYIKNYQGPHCLFCYGEDTTLSGETVVKVTMPTQVDKELFVLMQQLFGYEENRSFSRQLFAQYETVPLDQASLMAGYGSLVGSAYPEFFETVARCVIPEDRSLFLLSQHFFARNCTSFFSLWAKIGNEYPIAFWLSFWSEQLWRASSFIDLMRKEDFIAAKTVGFRLPFSFLKKDYKKVAVQDLIDTHNRLYELDWWVKNGAHDSCAPLERVYLRFLVG